MDRGRFNGLWREKSNLRKNKKGGCIISENCSLGVKASVLQICTVGSRSCTEIIVIDILKVQVVSSSDE